MLNIMIFKINKKYKKYIQKKISIKILYKFQQKLQNY